MDANQILNEMSTSPFLKGKDIGEGKQLKVTISKVELKEQERDGKTTKQLVLSCNGSKKILGLNLGNTKIAITNLGGETANWIGKELILYTEQTKDLSGNPTLGVRIRPEYSDEDIQTLTDSDEQVDMESIPSDL